MLLSIGFICIAHTDARSLFAGGLAGLILLVKLIAIPSFWERFNIWQWISATVLTVLFVWHQIDCVKATRQFEEDVRTAQQQWAQSPDGVIMRPTDKSPLWTRHTHWDYAHYFQYNFRATEVFRNRKDAKCMVLSPEEFAKYQSSKETAN